MFNKTEITNLIKIIAKEAGFSYCGISKAEFLEEEAPRLEKWLKENRHGKMQYMENYFDKRLDPRLLVDNAKSVISLMYNYFPSKTLNKSKYKISKYAYGQDYHTVVKEKLKIIANELKNRIGDINLRIFIDSAPVMDKAWAKRSGLGWIGKNSNLINKKSGSFFFLAEIILDVELEYDNAIKDYCGSCTRCLDACPTNAIIEPYVVDGSKCISYFTIELKDEIDKAYVGKFDNWIFGCDICQDVCPWNRFSSPHNEPLFNVSPALEQFADKNWEELTEDVFQKVFSKSAIKRTKYSGLKRNIQFVNLDRK